MVRRRPADRVGALSDAVWRDVHRGRVWRAQAASSRSRPSWPRSGSRRRRIGSRPTASHPRRGLGARGRSDQARPDRLARPGRAHSIYLFWHEDGELEHWYVNFEQPLRRTPVGFDTFDEKLDLIVRPDGSYRWKDEDELGRQRPSACSTRSPCRGGSPGVLWEWPFPTGWEDGAPIPRGRSPAPRRADAVSGRRGRSPPSSRSDCSGAAGRRSCGGALNLGRRPTQIGDCRASSPAHFPRPRHSARRGPLASASWTRRRPYMTPPLLPDRDRPWPRHVRGGQAARKIAVRASHRPPCRRDVRLGFPGGYGPAPEPDVREGGVAWPRSTGRMGPGPDTSRRDDGLRRLERRHACLVGPPLAGHEERDQGPAPTTAAPTQVAATRPSLKTSGDS